MRHLHAIILTAFLLVASFAEPLIASVTITTPIPVPNISQWKIVSYTDHDMGAAPSILVINVEFKGVGPTSTYKTVEVIVNEVGPSNTLRRNPDSQTAWDKIQVGSVELPTAYATITAAYMGASGGRVAKRAAAEQAMLTAGVVDATLNGGGQ